MSDVKTSILVVDDDLAIRELLHEHLSRVGYDVMTAAEGDSMRRTLSEARVDLIVLDVMLPGDDGFTLCREIREHSQVPIIMLTASSDETDRVVGLEIGADDYLAKPAREAELVARINALARRTSPDADKESLQYGPFEINTQLRTIALHGNVLTLTDKDFDLTLFLFQNQGRLLTREMLLERVWGLAKDINTRTVDTHMSRLRRRLGLNPENGFRIKTIYQRGYRLEAMKASGPDENVPVMEQA